MTKWKHRRIEVQTRQQMDENLEEFGQNHWELVHIERILELHSDGSMTDALSEPKTVESWMLFFKQQVEG